MLQEGLQEPDVQDGIEYWKTQSADYDGVLGELLPLTLSRVDRDKDSIQVDLGTA